MQRLSAKRVLFHFAETLCVSIDPCMYKKNMPVYFIWSSVSVADKWTQALSRLRDERPPPPDPSARSPLGRGALLVQLGLLKLGFFQFRVFWSMQRGRTHFYCNVASFQTVTCVTFLRSMKNCVVVNGTGLVLGSSNWKDLLYSKTNNPFYSCVKFNRKSCISFATSKYGKMPRLHTLDDN